MKTIYTLLVASLLVLTVMPSVLAVDIGTGIDIDIETEDFEPLIWQCDHRVVIEDCVEAGRTSDCSEGLYERITNYAFEGEQISWKVLVMDKNKIEQIQEVVGTIGSDQGVGNDIEVECGRTDFRPERIPDVCNARIDEEKLKYFDSDTMAFYECIFTVETPESMAGEHFLTVEVISVDGEATMDENEYWFLNPIIALTVDGDVQFENVRPGTSAYSNTILVGNDAEEGSGVLLDMFISGTDFYDLDASGAKCPTSNRLKLSHDKRSQARLGSSIRRGAGNGFTGGNDNNPDRCSADHIQPNPGNAAQPFSLGFDDDNADHLCYYATSGAYSTAGDPRADPESYVPIVYSDQFTRDFYNDAEIIQNGMTGGLDLAGVGPGLPAQWYHQGNVLSPGAEIALNFKLALPEPCVGTFDSGDIFFWGEAI
jgi:hypothetical protein